MKEPIFNCLHTPADSLPYNGQALMLSYIEDIKSVDGVLIYSQMCDCGYRMGRENEDYKYWNQCVCEDIDYHHYIELHKNSYIDPLVIYEDVWNWLYNHFRNIVYYSELSRSKEGFHFIFFFNVQRTPNNRMMCKSICNYVIHQAFDNCGYTDIINFEKVYDDCMDSFYQATFLTKNDYHINKECSGEGSADIISDNYFSIKTIYDKLTNKRITHKSSNNSYDRTDEWNIECDLNDGKYNGPYMNHHERWYLFKSLSGMCGSDREQLSEEWEKCAVQLPEGNGHEVNFYMSEPKRNSWYRLVDGNEYIDNELLKQFGYDIKFIKIQSEKNEDNTKPKKRIKSVRKEKVYIS